MIKSHSVAKSIAIPTYPYLAIHPFGTKIVLILNRSCGLILRSEKKEEIGGYVSRAWIERSVPYPDEITISNE